MVMVTGPPDLPDDITDVEGLTKHAYLPDAFAHLACADAAVVQGGLSTTMELVAAQRPFVYFPLARHWEQQHFVAHRLDHYRAGTRIGLRHDHAARPGHGHARRSMPPAALSGGAPERARRRPPSGSSRCCTP